MHAYIIFCFIIIQQVNFAVIENSTLICSCNNIVFALKDLTHAVYLHHLSQFNLKKAACDRWDYKLVG